uniref:Homologous recombination OB-fold protein OB-fold domain-containing protein n=1 Tax=Tanacetum cinerariifolium TaxID=118510 RepID=A0A6L2LCW2_TANCI|nr:hypothetical protein [Tanacetum cinerariifolium]
MAKYETFITLNDYPQRLLRVTLRTAMYLLKSDSYPDSYTPPTKYFILSTCPDQRSHINSSLPKQIGSQRNSHSVDYLERTRLQDSCKGSQVGCCLFLLMMQPNGTQTLGVDRVNLVNTELTRLRKMIMDVKKIMQKRNESVYYSVLRDLHRLQVIPQNLHHLIAISQEEYSLEIDDSDLHLTLAIRSSNSTHVEPSPYITNPVTIIPGLSGVVHVSSSTRVEPSTSNLNPVRIIPGPACLVQQARLLKEKVFILDPDGALMSTQQYMDKVVEDVGDNDDFKSAAWVSATNYVNTFGGTITGCLGDIDNFLKNRKLKQVVGIVKSCSPNMLGHLSMSLKDLSGTIPRIIHHKVIGKSGYGKDITVGIAMILTNVSVFSPNPLKHYLNITM